MGLHSCSVPAKAWPLMTIHPLLVTRRWRRTVAPWDTQASTALVDSQSHPSAPAEVPPLPPTGSLQTLGGAVGQQQDRQHPGRQGRPALTALLRSCGRCAHCGL